MEEEALIDNNFPLFSKRKKNSPRQPQIPQQSQTEIAIHNPQISDEHQQIEKLTPCNDEASCTFTDLGLPEWATKTCFELGMKIPTKVQQHCIPKILGGNDVLGLAHTGSGKTAAYVLPILQRLAENPYGVFALVIIPTRELAYQLADQFRALGSSLHVRCTVVVGGMNMITQAKTLMQRPHVVISTPGRIKVLLQDNPDIPSVFSRTKFLVLDEADRVLDVGFEEELRVIFKCLPKKRQTLLFSATMTKDLTTLHELSAKKAFFYEAYAGLETVESLRQQYLLLAENVKDVYLLHILSKIEDMGVRSAIIFVSEIRTCHLLALLLEEVDQEVVELHSMLPQSSRLASVHRFKSGQVPILLTTGVGERGLDIPTVDLVVNYDLPRCAADYVHRVGRTARAGRGGLVVSFVTGNEVDLIHEIEAELGKKMEEFECKEKEALADLSKSIQWIRLFFPYLVSQQLRTFFA
ncbi:DEAD-box ATP-dependent RNA helicase 36 isoform X2 [Beta vulgaris subsp. vulgaris]|uniref:DEAD-box ATP-dependent RNA helicase 36 isoform X2 n=1 Tax=Beta vulgaris subsp. vulgaris TaxID=3555 RepID=UPI002546BD49|nr:DEAD-box ATP-dependent RNA helicase 36 isoform X2 [Beta vulgaris subsp. vulgaris]